MQVVKKLRQLDKKLNGARHEQSAEAESKQISTNLLMMADPFVKEKFLLYQRMSKQKRGPSFLQRMKHDEEIRRTINQVNTSDSIDPTAMLESVFRTSPQNTGQNDQKRINEASLIDVFGQTLLS